MRKTLLAVRVDGELWVITSLTVRPSAVLAERHESYVDQCLGDDRPASLSVWPSLVFVVSRRLL